LWVNQTVNESLPSSVAPAMAAEAAAAAVLASGRFHTRAHETRGMATIYRLADGTRVLRLTDFETSNGPDVHVYLVKSDDVTDNATVKRAGYVDLGSIKGNVGDQNYEVPADLDLAAYRSVTIWCARFAVNFGTAPLMSDLAGEPMPAAASGMPVAELAGSFATDAHETRGIATVYRLGDGKRVLRLTGFETSNGPDVHVYLVAADAVPSGDVVKQAGFLDLGSIKGNIGDQNYDLPADVDLSKFRAVSIWCARFGVNFGAASLAPARL
jgi:hypothetical protein